ncbi:FecR family protein [Marinobacter sp.]|uniref:FecR family protein n=1 Tax=Marinobacter sp. TaxID=50741 RepID=UPI0019EB9567|nr:FecR family protein [Marinobacter sp.]MBE0486230.1 FecR domain-containing protein [Marinobacter sp.]
MLEFKRHGTAGLLLLLTLSLLPGVAVAEISVTRGSASAPAQQTGNTPEWVYTLRSGETLNDIAQALLIDHASLGQLVQYNNLASNAAASAGDQIRIPLNWLKRQPEPAKASSVTGNVLHVSGSTGQKSPLSANAIIRVGDEVISAAGSATIVLADGSELRMAPNSRLIFNRLTQYGKAGMADTRLRLQRGEVHTRVKPVMEQGSRFEIETPSAVAAVRGTVFSMQATASGSSVQITEGIVDFGRPGQTRRIPAGYGASVSTAGSAPMNIRRLPPAPVLNPIAPVLKQLPAELSWQADGANRYRVDIFEENSGAWLQSRDLSDIRFDISQLDNGRYDIHLAALDPQGITGMPAIASVEVDLQARTPDLVSPEEGQAVDDDMPEFHWQLNGTNEIARVEIADDEDFRRLITSSEWAPDNRALPSRPLSPGQYYWRVVSEAGGNSVATSATRTLVVNGTLPPVRIISINYIDSQVRVFWERVDTAKDYRLQLAEEPTFNNIIKEANVADTTAALRLIPGRRYFVRVKALSDGPLASRWGPGRELYLD